MVEQLSLDDPEDGLSVVKGAACCRRQADLDSAGGQAGVMPTEGDLLKGPFCLSAGVLGR